MTNPNVDVSFPAERCWLCGQKLTDENLAKLNEPACRVCGCRSSNVDRRVLEKTRTQIRQLVGELQELAQSQPDPEVLGPFLLQTLCHALAAFGASLWSVPQLNAANPKLVCTFGRTPSESVPTSVTEITRWVIKHNDSYFQELEIADNRYLIIGVPVAPRLQVQAAIEIFQRPGSSPTAQFGYVRFIKQMIDIVAKESSFFEALN